MSSGNKLGDVSNDIKYGNVDGVLDRGSAIGKIAEATDKQDQPRKIKAAAKGGDLPMFESTKNPTAYYVR
jgi:hypothetical protein